MRSLLCLAPFGLALVASAAVAQTPAVPPLHKVVLIVLENADYASALKQPFLSELTRSGALATHCFAERHPSQPNYIALVSGDTQGVASDRNVNLDARHLGDLLEEKGRSWKVYSEGYPGSCFQGATHGDYARKHVPFVSFKNVHDDPARCARIVEAAEFAHDVAAGQLPDFSLYVPDLRDDGHNTGVAYGSRWLGRTFGPLLADPGFAAGTTVIVTFDEGEDDGTNQIYTAFAGAGVKPGATCETRTDHYSILRTLELGFGLGSLGKHDDAAVPVTGIWR